MFSHLGADRKGCCDQIGWEAFRRPVGSISTNSCCGLLHRYFSITRYHFKSDIFANWDYVSHSLQVTVGCSQRLFLNRYFNSFLELLKRWISYSSVRKLLLCAVLFSFHNIIIGSFSNGEYVTTLRQLWKTTAFHKPNFMRYLLSS